MSSSSRSGFCGGRLQSERSEKNSRMGDGWGMGAQDHRMMDDVPCKRRCLCVRRSGVLGCRNENFGCEQPWTASLQTFGQHKSCSSVPSERGEFLHRHFNIRSPLAALDGAPSAKPSAAQRWRRTQPLRSSESRPFAVQGGPPTGRGKIVIATWIAGGDRPHHPVRHPALIQLSDRWWCTQETTPSATRSITRSLAAKKSAGRRMVKS